MPALSKRLIHAKPNEGFFVTERVSQDAPTVVAIAYDKFTSRRVEVSQDDNTGIRVARLYDERNQIALVGSSDSNDPDAYGFESIFGGPLPQSDARDIAMSIAQAIFYTV